MNITPHVSRSVGFNNDYGLQKATLYANGLRPKLQDKP